MIGKERQGEMNQGEMTAAELWEKACAVIKNKIPQDTYTQWFESVVPVRTSSRTVC